MTTKEMIETLRYKANNIKAKIEPEFFNDVADSLEEYKELEEQGLLKKLGDTVYIIGCKYRHGIHEKWINTGRFKYSDLEKLNKTVFLTKEAAEEALKKMKVDGIDGL